MTIRMLKPMTALHEIDIWRAANLLLKRFCAFVGRACGAAVSRSPCV